MCPTRVPLTILFVGLNWLSLRRAVIALRATGRFRPILEADQEERGLRLAGATAPEVVVLQSDSARSRPVAMVRSFVPVAPMAKIIVITAEESDEAVLDVLRAGAAGVLAPDLGTTALVQALVGAARGEAAVSRHCATRLVRAARQELPRRAGMRPVRSSLTAREWEVFDLLASGSPEEAIAHQLGVTTGTIRSHVRQLSRKLQTEAARMGELERGPDPGRDPPRTG